MGHMKYRASDFSFPDSDSWLLLVTHKFIHEWVWPKNLDGNVFGRWNLWEVGVLELPETALLLNKRIGRDSHIYRKAEMETDGLLDSL